MQIYIVIEDFSSSAILWNTPYYFIFSPLPLNSIPLPPAAPSTSPVNSSTIHHIYITNSARCLHKILSLHNGPHMYPTTNLVSFNYFNHFSCLCHFIRFPNHTMKPLEILIKNKAWLQCLFFYHNRHEW